MSRFSTSLVAALAFAVLAAGGFTFVQHRHAREAVSLRRKNDRTRFAASEGTVAIPAAPATVPSHPTAGPARGSRPARVDGSAQYPPPPASFAEDFRNEGQDTPFATLQTFACACDRGDIETVAQMLCFTDRARVKAVAFMAAQPPDVRAQWPSLEDMAASIVTAQALYAPFPNARILEQATATRSSDERIFLHLPGTARERTGYQKVGDAWKYVITEAMVDDYVPQASQAAACR